MVKTDVVERRILPEQSWRSSSAVGKDMGYAELRLLLFCVKVTELSSFDKKEGNPKSLQGTMGS